MSLYTNIYLNKLWCKSSYLGGLRTSGGAIPDWNLHGVLPPIDPSNPVSEHRSPYMVSVTDLVPRFGLSPERLDILKGLFLLRSELHKIGLVKGFQWLDGSFSENIELLQSRSPNDIDVVTFFHPPDSKTEDDLLIEYPQLFDKDRLKNTYHVDAYWVGLPDGGLEKNELEELVADSIYWYGVWSHQRNSFSWKGYLQIDLSPTDDNIALEDLYRAMSEGGAP